MKKPHPTGVPTNKMQITIDDSELTKNLEGGEAMGMKLHKKIKKNKSEKKKKKKKESGSSSDEDKTI